MGVRFSSAVPLARVSPSTPTSKLMVTLLLSLPKSGKLRGLRSYLMLNEVFERSWLPVPRRGGGPINAVLSSVASSKSSLFDVETTRSTVVVGPQRQRLTFDVLGRQISLMYFDQDSPSSPALVMRVFWASLNSANCRATMPL